MRDVKNKPWRVLSVFMGLLVLLAMAGQPVQAREGDGAATGLDVQADTDAPLIGLTIDLIAARVDEGPTTAPFDESAQVLGLDALNSTITADTVNAATQHQPFLNQVDSSASTENLAVILDLLGVNLVDLDSTTIASNAQVTGSCGAFTASGGTTIEDLSLSVLGQSVEANLTATPDPDTELLNTVINVDLGLSALSADALVILNEQTVAGDQSSIDVNALRIFLDITVSGLTNLTQTVEIVVSRSEAAFANCNDVDLEVEKTTSLAGNATVNVPFDYTVTITETSNNADATAVQFTDTLPGEVEFLSFIDQGGGSCTHDSGIITCQWLTVPAGGSVSATYRVNPTTTGTATNGVTVTTGDNDTDPDDDSDSVDVEIDPAGGTNTDLAVSFVNSTPADGPVGVQQTVEIEVTDDNNGTGPTNATLVYTVSPDATIGTITQSIFDTCTVMDNTVTCSSASLADSTNGTLQIEVTPTTAGTNTHTVNVTSDVPDDDLTNNTAEATVNVTAADSNVDLQVTVTDDPDPGTEGEPVTYIIDIENTGTEDAENVVLDVDLGGVPVTIDSATPDQGSCTISGTEVTCDLGTVGAGGGTAVEIVATPNGIGTLTLTGTVEDDAGNSAPVSEDTTIQAAEADLTVTLDGPTSGTVDEPAQYTATITNNENNPIDDVTLDIVIPDGLTVVSIDDAAGGSCVIGSITCTGLSVPANGSVDIVFTLTPDTGGQQLIEATVGTSADPGLDSDQLQILVTLRADGAPQAIPTLSEYGLMLMLALMALFMLRTRPGMHRR